MVSIGVDIGGSHISCVAVNTNTGEIVKESFNEAPVQNTSSAESILSAWCSAIQETIDAVGDEILTGIGFAMPGPFDYVNGIGLFSKEVRKFGSLYGVNIASSIRKGLKLPEETPVRFINDATAFAIGEAWIGQAAGVERMMAITLGTGFGSAFLKNGIPVVDGEEVPEMGCVYHLPFKESIADDNFSTRWFLNNYENRKGERLEGVKEIAERYDKDDIAKELFAEFGSNLAEFLGPWLKRFGVESLVIGGNISRAFHLFGPALQESLKNQEITTQIGISKLKEEAALVGSAHLLNDEYYNEVLQILSKM